MKRSMAARDLDAILNTAHLSSCDYSPSTSETVLFSTNSTCILSPEGEIGPYRVSYSLLRMNPWPPNRNYKDGRELAL